MTEQARQVIAELQEVLSRHGAALFFSDENDGELWINGECHAHITHEDGSCALVESPRPCEIGAAG